MLDEPDGDASLSGDAGHRCCIKPVAGDDTAGCVGDLAPASVVVGSPGHKITIPMYGFIIIVCPYGIRSTESP